MSSVNGEVRLPARSLASISQEGSLKSPFLHPGDGGAVDGEGRGGGAARSPSENKASKPLSSSANNNKNASA